MFGLSTSYKQLATSNKQPSNIMHTHLHHDEEHLKSSDLIRDVVIGMSDGLTVPFALAAGLSGAVSQPV